MKLLLTADFHFRTDWFRWLMEQAPSYDLVCVAGDLLDMFSVESTKGQARGSWHTDRGGEVTTDCTGFGRQFS
jgi:Icc-related predicted phosphoesterase